MNTCPACGNRHGNEFLGTLGGAEWHKCRACGAITTPAPAGAVGDTDELGVPTTSPEGESHPLKPCTKEEYREALKGEVSWEEFDTQDSSIFIAYNAAGEVVAIARYEAGPRSSATIKKWCCNAK
jgi:hypothetical protein